MFRSFNTVNMGSVGQRASELLAVKVGGLKKKSAIRTVYYLNNYPDIDPMCLFASTRVQLQRRIFERKCRVIQIFGKLRV